VLDFFLMKVLNLSGAYHILKGIIMKFPIKGSHFQNEGEVSENIF
jgi:hypothetical protein